MRTFDVVVVGTGPAGQRAAIQAAKLGRKVLAIERRRTVGGGAVATGTIPSKTLREAVMHLTGLRERSIYGVSYAVKRNITVADLTFRLDHVIRNEVAVVESQLMRNGVELAYGVASFNGPHRMRIGTGTDQDEIEAGLVVLAPGSEPALSPKFPVDGKNILDTECLFGIRCIPKRLTVVGGGVIGVEYANIFAALGVKVTLVERLDRILGFVDREVVDALVYHMRDQGVVFRLGEEVESCVLDGETVVATTASRKTITGDCLLYTVGRQGATADLNLESVGLTADARGRIPVDAHYQTAVPWVYAAGDVIGFPALAATSLEQGRAAVRHGLGVATNGVNRVFPLGIYTVPEISMVGRTEEELTHDGVPYETGTARYGETARGQILGDNTGRLKILVHAQDRALLGVHIIGEGATELVHIGQMVMGLGGKLDFLVDSVFNYPTLAECYKIAALDAFNRLSVRACTNGVRAA